MRSRSLDEQIVRVVCIGFNQLFKLASSFNTPKGFQTVSQFSAKNLEHLFTDKNLDKEWSKVKIADMHQVDAISDCMKYIMWATLTLGRYVNSYRRNSAMTTINWIEEATEYDKRRNEHAKEIGDGEKPDLEKEFSLKES